MSYLIGKKGESYPRPLHTPPGSVMQGHFVQAIDPGQNQDVVAAAPTPLLNGAGAELRAVLLQDVQPTSVFRLSFGIGQIIPTVIGGANAEILFRGRIFNDDDPNFPNNYNPFGRDLGHIAGTVVFVSTAFGYEGYVSQAQIAALKGDNEPTVGKMGFRMEVALANDGGVDTVRIPLFPGAGAQDVWLGIEEIAGGALTIE